MNDPTDTTAYGTRWLATAGTILKYEGGKYGLLFSGGGCIDGDSDAFRYIGYAESRDLLQWTVINSLNNPILITQPYSIEIDANGHPVASGGNEVSVPKIPAVGGATSGFFAGRVYAPSATPAGDHDLTVFFAGYHTPKPKNGLGDYRPIGRISIHSRQKIDATSTDPNPNNDDDDSGSN